MTASRTKLRGTSRRKRRMDLLRTALLHLVLAGGGLLFLVPFLWLVSTSLKPDKEAMHYPPELVPRAPATVVVDGQERRLADFRETRVALMGATGQGYERVRVVEPSARAGEVLTVKEEDLRPVRRPVIIWRNYPRALRFLPAEYAYGLLPLWNTLYITILSILGTVLSSSLVAYSFARIKWPGRDVLFTVMLATMMLPGAVTMLPVFLIFRWLNWVDTLRPLWVGSFFGGAFFIFMLRQFFLTIPSELEDAARIDGCSHFGVYWRIMLPLVKPALAAVAIWTFMGRWNDFMGALIYISSPENMTVAYALQLYRSTPAASEQPLLMAAATLVMLPVLLVFFFTQRYFIEGVTLTGIKS